MLLNIATLCVCNNYMYIILLDMLYICVCATCVARYIYSIFLLSYIYIYIYVARHALCIHYNIFNSYIMGTSGSPDIYTLSPRAAKMIVQK